MLMDAMERESAKRELAKSHSALNNDRVSMFETKSFDKEFHRENALFMNIV